MWFLTVSVQPLGLYWLADSRVRCGSNALVYQVATWLTMFLLEGSPELCRCKRISTLGFTGTTA